MYTKNGVERCLRLIQTNVPYQYVSYSPRGRKSYYRENILNGYIEAYINLAEAPILIGGKLLK